MPNILSCPHCAAVVVLQEAGSACPHCRTPLPESLIETMLPPDVDATRLAAGSEDVDAGTAAASRAPSDQTPSPSSAPRQPSDRAASDPRSPSGAGTSSGWLSSSGAIDHGRFAPGALLGGRYRIIQRLGRGGMGEVYRADDLKLGQPVALKFLSADVDRDPARLTQLHSEVRMARQVSHPNVCRVYDIDEVDGSTFLSMEYVDGEDLASLLRRIGRFPEDRGLEIARQICAGLAAAHERGVVHRDLKPANIMLDGTGKVRITDFGLAGLAGESIRAGTPAYMSPEQLAGDKVSAKSDIYSLGLVLYEVFTGQRALEGRNLAELIHKREQSGVVPPTEIVKTLDPKIEAAILRCLRPTPDERPASALTVAAALPGGDPLAAALAAGETPSPEMVAAAGPTEALHPALGLSLVAFVVAALMAYAAMSDRYSLFTRVPMRKSLDSLQDRARDILGALGYEPAGQHSTRGLAINFDVIRHIRDTDQSADRWNALNDRRAPVMVFWYRSSPQPLVPIGSNWNATLSDPPMAVAGMTRVSLDDTGKLVEFEAVPPRADDPARPAGASPWPALFQAAGLDLGAFHPVDPVLLPKAFATERAAWEGPAPGVDGATLHVEASAHRGAAISFRATGPWEPAVPRTTPPIPQSNLTWRTIANTLGSVLVFATLLLARSNLRAGRGDRRGAWRLLCVAMAALVASWIVSARHYTSLLIEDERLFEFLAHALMNAGTVWLLYIALEPYVRRFAPGILISWTRVLSGRIVDPRVGRDLLVGAAVGVSIALLGMTYFMVPELLGEPPGDPRVANLQLLLGTPVALGAILRMIPNNLQNGLFVAFAFGVGRVMTRRVWGGAVLAGGLLGIFVLGESTGNRPFISLLYIAALVVPLVVTLLYCGLLSVVIAFLVNQAINNSPLTLHLSLPHAPDALWAVLLVLSLAVFGFYASRGRQPMFGRLLHAD